MCASGILIQQRRSSRAAAPNCSLGCDDCKERALLTAGGVRDLFARAACVPRVF